MPSILEYINTLPHNFVKLDDQLLLGSAPPVSGKDNGVHSELSKVMEGDMAIGSSWDEEDEKAGSNHAGTMKSESLWGG